MIPALLYFNSKIFSLGEFKSGVFIRRTGIKIVLQEEFEVFEFRRTGTPVILAIDYHLSS